MVLRGILIISVERVLSGVTELVLHFSYLYVTSMEGMVVTAFEEFPECSILFIQLSDLGDEVVILGYYGCFDGLMWGLEWFLCYPKELVIFILVLFILVILFIILVLFLFFIFFILIFFILGVFIILPLHLLPTIIRGNCYITEYLFTKWSWSIECWCSIIIHLS